MSQRGLLRVHAWVVGGLSASVLIAWPLFSPGREYPLAPFLPGLDRVPASLFVAVCIATLGCITLMPWQPRWLLPAAGAGVALVVGQDQTRLQPWLYAYVALAAILALGFRDGSDEAALRAKNACRLLLVAIYFWSGVHKLNSGFVEATPWLFGPLVRHLPQLAPAVRPIGFVLPAIEAFLGLGLLWPRARRFAVGGLIAMHALLLSLLGPWALDYNAVVWPWNVAMPFILYELFWSSGLPASEVLRSGAWRSQWAAIVLFALLPALSLVDLWDDDLSFSLYGGNTLFADVILPSTTLSRLAPRARQVAEGLPDGRFRLALDDWAHEALHVPAYPAERVHRRVARVLCPLAGTQVLELVLFRSSAWLYRSSKAKWISGAELCGRNP